MVRVSIDGPGHPGAGSVAGPAVADRCGLVVSRGHSFGGDVGGVEYFVSGDSLQVDRQVETLPREVVHHREHPVGIRVADDRTVLVVDHAIVVQILEADVARCGSVLLEGVVVNLLLGLEQPVGDISVEDVDGLTVLLHGHVGAVDLVLVKRRIAVEAYDLVSVPCGCQ